MLSLRTRQVDAWPSLAWVAECRTGEGSVEVRHGPRVEVCDGWFAEATWDGDWALGDLDRTDLVFGSGGRCRPEGVVFVSSGTTVDRLHALAFEGGFRVSNSLPGLMHAAGARLDPSDDRFYDLFGSITAGLDDCERWLPTSLGPLELVYFDNLRWDGARLERVAKPDPRRDFSRFDAYRAFMTESVRRIAANLADPARARPLRMLGTISAGYDSATVSVLAREAGLEEVITFDRARDGHDDGGAALAERLDLRVTRFAREAWRERPLAEVPYLAADAKGEDVAFDAIGPRLEGCVLFTGFHGGRVWAKHQADPRPLARGDRSGLSLCEARLAWGAVHAPLPYLGARRSAELAALSASPELAPWDVPGDYSRPLCRRIVEEAGIPREAFGIRKQATSALFRAGDEAFTDAAERDFEDWLREHAAAWWRRGRLRPRQLAPLTSPLRPLQHGAVGLLHRAARGRLAVPMRRSAETLLDLGRGYRFAFPWAVERAMRCYAEEASPSG